MKLLFVKFPFGTEMRMSQQNHEGGWSGIGMATVGIHPNDFDLYPNKIPPGRVVQNCQFSDLKMCWCKKNDKYQVCKNSMSKLTKYYANKQNVDSS